MDLVEQMMPYAPVLERVVDLVNADGKLKYGDALAQAKRELGVEVPEDVERAIIVAAFKVSLNGFPTKVRA